jgi:hypothetical protein
MGWFGGRTHNKSKLGVLAIKLRHIATLPTPPRGHLRWSQRSSLTSWAPSRRLARSGDFEVIDCKGALSAEFVKSRSRNVPNFEFGLVVSPKSWRSTVNLFFRLPAGNAWHWISMVQSMFRRQRRQLTACMNWRVQ